MKSWSVLNGVSMCVGILTLVACERAIEPTAARPLSADYGESSRLFMAPTCEQDSVRLASGKTLPAMNAGRSEGKDRVCINSELKIPMSEQFLHVYAIGPYENYIVMHCENGEQMARTLNAMSDQGELALVVSEEVVATYRYLDKSSLAEKCGTIPSSDISVAMDICDDIVGKLRGSAEECTRICDLNKSSDLMDVCLVANAESLP